MGIKEDVVWSELRSLGRKPPERAVEKNLKQQLTTSKGERRVSDIQVLNLLVHHPHTVSRLMDCECEVLLTDPVVMGIIDTIFKRYRQEAPLSSEELLESLDSEPAREQVREILHRPFTVFSDQEAEQALVEIETKAYQKKISASLASYRKGKGDAETLNQLLKLKRLKGRQDLDSKKSFQNGGI